MSEILLQQQQSKTLFLKTLAESGSVTASAKESGISRSTAYKWRSADEIFAAAWDEALAEATDSLAYEARRRALEGIEEVRYFKGEPIGTIRRYSDQLLMFLLRAYRPDVYRQATTKDTNDAESVRKARDDLSRKMERLTTKHDSKSAKDADK